MRAVKTEKQNKYDLLGNNFGALQFNTRIKSYIITWEEIYSFCLKYRKEFNIDSRTQSCVQTKVLKMILQNFSIKA